MTIGLTGANASGKGEAAGYLKSRGFEYYSLSDILREEASLRKVDPSRENLIRLGNELREKKGPSVLADMVVKKIENNKGNYVIDSIRNPFEVKALKRLSNFTLIGIDAPLKIRFKRAATRKRPGDPETLREFIEKEKKENIAKSTNQQLANCLKLADVLIINDSTMENFYRKLDLAVKL